MDFASIGLVRDQITFVVNLSQGFFRRSVQLKFKDVDIFRGLDYGVCTTSGTFDFDLGELAPWSLFVIEV